MYSLSVGPGPPAGDLDLSAALVLLLVDGRRRAEEIESACPLDPEITARQLRKLRTAGLIVPAGRTPTSEPPWRHLLDLDAPPARVLDAAPRLVGAIDPADVSGAAEEYFLLSRLDGATPIGTLSAMTGMSLPTLLRRLTKHHERGTVAMPGALVQCYRSSGPHGESDQAERLLDLILTDDALVKGLLRASIAVRAAPGTSELSHDARLVLERASEHLTVASVARATPRPVRETVRAVLELYRSGHVLLGGTSEDDEAAREADDADDTVSVTVGAEPDPGRRLLRGSLADKPFESLLDELAQQRVTGTLHVRLGAVQRELWLAHGAVVWGHSGAADESTASVLWRTGVLDRDSYMQVLRACRADADRTQEELLEELGTLLPDEIHAARVEALIECVCRLFHLVPWSRVPSHKFAALDAAAGVAPPWRGARPRLRRRALAATPIARKLPQGTTVPGD